VVGNAIRDTQCGFKVGYIPAGVGLGAARLSC
jgi:hypothetical protein